MTKKILITGRNSYVGNQLTDYLNKEPEKYTVVKKSVRDGKWKELDFSNYDVVIHVAGIAHQDTKKDQEDLYYKVNTNLTIDIASRAKEAGVKQFIFMSSIIVYGESGRIGVPKVITKETIPEPSNFYGNSKLLAEKGIKPLQSSDFNVVIIRPPMIYGKGSRGNYPILAKFAKILPVFPDIENQRSMIYIENLSELIRIIINNKENGLFFPQNKEYVKTSNMVKTISEVAQKKIWLVKLPLNIVSNIFKRMNIVNKVFGNLVYEKSMSEYKVDYNINDFYQTILKTER